MCNIFNFPKTQTEKNIDLIKRHEKRHELQGMKNNNIVPGSEKSRKEYSSEENNYISKKHLNSDAKKMNDISKVLESDINSKNLKKQPKKDNLHESKGNEKYENSGKKLNNRFSIKTNSYFLKKNLYFVDYSSINSEAEEELDCEVQEEKEENKFSKINTFVKKNWEKYLVSVNSDRFFSD